jgi:hypothetical protein
MGWTQVPASLMASEWSQMGRALSLRNDTVKSKASGPCAYSSRPNCVEAGTSVIWGGVQ